MKYLACELPVILAAGCEQYVAAREVSMQDVYVVQVRKSAGNLQSSLPGTN